MKDDPKGFDARRKRIHKYLASLTPQEGQALRESFNMPNRDQDKEEPLRELARMLARRKKSPRR